MATTTEHPDPVAVLYTAGEVTYLLTGGDEDTNPFTREALTRAVR